MNPKISIKNLFPHLNNYYEKNDEYYINKNCISPSPLFIKYDFSLMIKYDIKYILLSGDDEYK